MTPLRKPVDLQKLNELVSIGFEKELAVEALRRNENDTQKALDDLTNPETNSVMQIDVESRKKKRLLRAIPAANEELVSMGFPRAIVDAALRRFGTQEQALNHLLGQPNANAVVVGANPSVQSLNIPGLDAGQGLETSMEEDGEGPSSRAESRIEMQKWRMN
ncbi:NEDD8 ultimate buster 1 [Olea europaea subsp. europaea]|uniref:NEDD8 ultimate buster 1 n=1 Tax=Olea europaea subsp. europaea TaxID=158383 RepID=A0A8S0UU66_OLEEU|nr:NEDD8 ultimate buster 1 [Olea europaea subsp. europaea]